MDKRKNENDLDKVFMVCDFQSWYLKLQTPNVLINFRNKGLVSKWWPYVPLHGYGWQIDLLMLYLLVGDHRKEMMYGVKAGPPLVIGIYYKPGTNFCIGMGEHLVFGHAIFNPSAS